MHGALIAKQQTGSSLNVHPGRDEDQPQEVMAFVQAQGGEPSHIIISHIDSTIADKDKLIRLADTGCMIEFDLCGQEQSLYSLNLQFYLRNDAIRLRMVRRLIDRGQLDQIAISNDICYRSRLQAFGDTAMATSSGMYCP